MASSILPISKKSTTWYRQRLVLVLLVIGVQLLLNFFYINKGVLFLSKTASCIQGTTGGTPPTSTSTNQTAAVSSTNTANISVSRSTDHIAVNAVKTTTNTGVRGTSTTTTIAPPDSSSSNTSCWNSDFQFDIVVTWVNTSADSWLEVASKWDQNWGPVYPPNADRSNTFLELKYMLRGWWHALQPSIRNVYIVMSDHHDPPVYFQDNHPQLRFIRHSSIVPKSALPLLNRNAINMALHRIPGLAEHWIYLNDDFFVTPHVSLQHFLTDTCRIRTHMSPGDGSQGANDLDGNVRAIQLLRDRFGQHNRTRSNSIVHYPQMNLNSQLQEQEQIWFADINRTWHSKTKESTNVEFKTFSQNYLIDKDLAVYHSHGEPSVHFNANEWCPKCDGIHKDIANVKLPSVTRVLDTLAKGAGHAAMYNIQGMGMDDAYRFRIHKREDSPKLRALIRPWLEKTFPWPAPWEL